VSIAITLAAPRSQPAVLHRVKARAHDVAREQGHLVAHALRDLAQDKIRGRDQGPLGLGALQRAERRPVAEGARGVALVKPAAAAEVAAPAGGLKAAQDPVPHRDALDRVADGKHGADVLVADREARLDLHAAVVDVQIRAAHAGGLDLHDRIARV
jgi:hypothetical protein